MPNRFFTIISWSERNLKKMKSYQVKSGRIVVDIGDPDLENRKTGPAVLVRGRHRNVVSVLLFSIKSLGTPDLAAILVLAATLQTLFLLWH